MPYPKQKEPPLLSSSPPSARNASSLSFAITLAAYVLFGWLHECLHVSVAKFFNVKTATDDDDGIGNFFKFTVQAMLGRACFIPGLEHLSRQSMEYLLIRHVPWIMNVIVVAVLFYFSSKKVNNIQKRILIDCFYRAALVTALEGITTDVFGFGTVAYNDNNNINSHLYMFCGNFGVILLHPAWTSDKSHNGSKTALDLLEKMIEITMMRGAQTGGVVAWKGYSNQPSLPKGIRTRVVNGKRTDLSKLLRQELNTKLGSGKMDSSIQCLMGHTRFATTSKATLDGTHPHQWSSPQALRVYKNLYNDTTVKNAKEWKPATQIVENYITHNGDLDFYKIGGEHIDLETLQEWLPKATGFPMPCTVDSAAIAGFLDLLRTAGCFALSIRYALLLGGKFKAAIHSELPFPTMKKDYDRVALLFEQGLEEYVLRQDKKHDVILGCLQDLKSKSHRAALADVILHKFYAHQKKNAALSNSSSAVQQVFPDTAFYYITVPSSEQQGDLEACGGVSLKLRELIESTIDAFLDNDLFFSTKVFMSNAVGSFGLMMTSSLDANQRICIAARGQPMSVALYPDTGIVCYGSEQAAVKAGMMYEQPKMSSSLSAKHPPSRPKTDKNNIANMTCRLDLDDLGGEVVMLDWTKAQRDPTAPMVDITVYSESKSTSHNLRDRVTPLDGNEFLLPLNPTTNDPVLADIQDIPRALDNIIDDWREGSGLNRITAWNLARKLRNRLQRRVNGDIPVGGSTVDILVTGCEVSLWLAEQFAGDLQKCFPNLFIKSISSNKLLGVLGQELAVPSIGFPITDHTDLKDTIVLIVSHSGGTFGPLAVSNLLQSVTQDIFVVASEWDTQIGKQLRSMYSTSDDIFSSRIFTTNIGVRPAEPCSLSVVATHQLLTQIFEYMCLVILANHSFRHLSGAVITEKDLQILERCNLDNILALERLVGRNADGSTARQSEVEKELRSAGSLWAEHILENARAYILSIIYVLATVTSGYPIVSGIATAAGLNADWAFYITRFFDALIYIFLPQINITLIRLVQGRNIMHRMVGRTVVVGDIPWVAQSADAFLSKLFARSYSIAGLNVLHGNPADHLVHRHTHRVVRGSLLVCGRPDGRLTALTSAECAVNLAVNQASSIQSIGGTCESITIGHNPSPLALTKQDIILGSCRSKFLCEKILGSIDAEAARKQNALVAKQASRPNLERNQQPEKSFFRKALSKSLRRAGDPLNRSMHSTNSSGGGTLNRSTHSLKGAYLGLQAQSSKGEGSAKPESGVAGGDDNKSPDVVVKAKTLGDRVLEELIRESNSTNQIREIFSKLDADGGGTIDLDEFIEGYEEVTHSGLSREALTKMFHEADVDDSGSLDFDEFKDLLRLPEVDILRKVNHSCIRDDKGRLQIEPSNEDYFGAELRAQSTCQVSAFAQSQSQHLSMELYESRIASMQRYVAMCVMFHQMGKQVQEFFPKYSFGLLGYNMDKTHSIMRIATTASPVSGDAVRDKMEYLRLRARYQNAAQRITGSWRRYKTEKITKEWKKHSSSSSSMSKFYAVAEENIDGTEVTSEEHEHSE